MVRIRRRSGCYRRLIPLNLCRYTFSGYDPPGFPSTAPPCEQLSNFTTERGKPAIVHDNKIFTFRRELHDGTLRWRCRQRSCYAAIATDAGKKNFVLLRGHNHASITTCKMELEQVRQSLKRKANALRVMGFSHPKPGQVLFKRNILDIPTTGPSLFTSISIQCLVQISAHIS